MLARRDGIAVSARGGVLHPASVPHAAASHCARQPSTDPPPQSALPPALPADAGNTLATRSMLSEQLSRGPDEAALPVPGVCCPGATAELFAAAEGASRGISASSGTPVGTSAAALVHVHHPPGPPAAAAAGSGVTQQHAHAGRSARALQQSSSEPALLAKARRDAAGGAGMGAGAGVHARGGRMPARRSRARASDSRDRAPSEAVGASATSGLSELDMSGDFNLR